MKFDKDKKKNIILYLLEKIEQNTENPSQIVSETFGINRNTVHTYINELVEQKLITRVKRGQYELVNDEYVFHLSKNKGDLINETNIYNKYLKNYISHLSPNVQAIWEYAFSEMVNNVIDHSDSKNLCIVIKQNYLNTLVGLSDSGVGIFEKIKNHFDLPNLDAAICELFKGKLTTDENNHSGEGIFFTSKIMDKFTIWSSEKVFTNNKFDGSKIINSPQNMYNKGTCVIMSLSNYSHKHIQEIFDKYADIEGGFNKTILPLKNIFDASPVSRSQARRVLNSLDKFEEVVMDFEDVDWIGQGFAHQIFVVFKAQHPEIKIIPVNMNEVVTKMLNHVINTKL